MSQELQRKIPILELGPEIEEQWDELMEAIQGVLRSRRFILGPNVKAFEEEVATHLGVKYAIGVNSGTDALVISLRALGIGPGDEVITTPFTFFATPESISSVGAAPVFVDIDPATFNIDPELIEPAITERTKAILPVHLFGQACDMDPIMEIARRYRLKVIEDVAQAVGGAYKGRRLGGFGDAAALSFFPSKNLGGFGDGGMVTTDDDDVAASAMRLRTHGSSERYHNEVIGYNSRLDEIQAALLRVRLRRLEAMNEARRSAAARYGEVLATVSDLRTPTESSFATHVFHQFTVRIVGGDRDDLRRRLSEAGVSSRIYYPIPCHRLTPYADQQISLPRAEGASEEVLSLPMGPSISNQTIDTIALILAEWAHDAMAG